MSELFQNTRVRLFLMATLMIFGIAMWLFPRQMVEIFAGNPYVWVSIAGAGFGTAGFIGLLYLAEGVSIIRSLGWGFLFAAVTSAIVLVFNLTSVASWFLLLAAILIAYLAFQTLSVTQK